MKEKLGILVDACIKSDAVRKRFVQSLGPAVTRETEVDDGQLKDELRGFARENPECMSYILIDI